MQDRPQSPSPLYRLLGVCLALLPAASSLGQGAGAWALSPYRIQAVVAVDSISIGSNELAEQIAEHLGERSDSAIGALWDLEVVIAKPGQVGTVLRLASGDFEDFSSPPLFQESDEGTPVEAPDKTLLVGVIEDSRGIRVSVVEYDEHLHHWGRPATQEVASIAAAPEAVFRLACDVFSPLATFRVAANNPEQIELSLRGNELPVRQGAPQWVEKGDVFLPVLRRVDRDGKADEDGIREVPWTYLILNELGDIPKCDFVSHTRRPLAARRRGRVDYIAMLLPRERSETTLRAHAREDENRPLIGYQVYTQDGPEAERKLVGATGPDGRLAIPPGESPVLMAYIKSGSQLVAKLPIASGGQRELNVPLLDETPRLNAEAKLGILREDLIDLVAQRQILIARINAAIDEKDFDSARGLIEKLERLPARAIFDRQLRQLEQSSRSDVPMVQKRIDQIFADTRTVLAAFLNPREVQEVKTRLANSRK